MGGELLRTLKDGTLDSHFGFNGMLVLSSKILGDLVPCSGGNYLLLHTNVNDSKASDELVNLDTDGQYQSSFGEKGIVAIPSDFHLSSLVMLSDGKLLTAGTRLDTVVLMRFLANGTQDTKFGTNGIIGLGMGPSSKQTLRFHFERDTRLIVTTIEQSGDQKLFRHARYYLDGSIDRTFGDSGTITTQTTCPIGGAWMHDLAIDRDGSFTAYLVWAPIWTYAPTA